MVTKMPSGLLPSHCNGYYTKLRAFPGNVAVDTKGLLQGNYQVAIRVTIRVATRGHSTFLGARGFEVFLDVKKV